MNILVTGAAGYLGSALCPVLLAAGHSVITVDSFRYGPQQATTLAACCANPNFELHRIDVRNHAAMRPFLKRVDIVIPLAALVGAPLCAAFPEEAREVNEEAIRFISQSLSADQLLIFPNTNSGYGVMSPGSNAQLDEDSPLNPISVYGRTKCKAEEYVLWRENSVIFRLATVFGASPRMRTDLMLNDFVLRAARDRSVVLFEPNARRNFVHVRDVADAFLWAIRAMSEKRIVSGNFGNYEHLGLEHRVFNLGHDGTNVTKAELCAKIAEHVPGFKWYEGAGSDPDKRDYLVSNARLRAAGFEARRTLGDGIIELLKLYRGFQITAWGNV